MFIQRELPVEIPRPGSDPEIDPSQQQRPEMPYRRANPEIDPPRYPHIDNPDKETEILPPDPVPDKDSSPD